jgi:hypothetical protein
MGGSEVEVIGAYNAFIEEQQKLAKRENVTLKATLVLFDHLVDTIYKKVPIDKVEELTSDVYKVRGRTSLYDAIGQTIQEFSDKKRVIVFIETDGWENSSKEYSSNTVKALVKEKTDAGWDFNFVGADLDAATTSSMGATLGISSAKTMSFGKTVDGYTTRNASFLATTSDYVKNN